MSTHDRRRVELDDASLQDVSFIRQKLEDDGFPATMTASVRFAIRTAAKQLQSAEVR